MASDDHGGFIIVERPEGCTPLKKQRLIVLLSITHQREEFDAVIKRVVYLSDKENM